jgi:hypothetical protein
MALFTATADAGNTSSSSATSGTNFAAGGEDVLKILLQQLLAGGTPEQRLEAQRRAEEIATVRGTRGDYTKQAAFLDAQGAMAGESRKALEKLVPSITKAAEGAGTSASSMRALLLQDAANKAAESASALGLKAAVDYGGVNSNLSAVLQSLTAQNNPVTKALLEAIMASKGQQSTQQQTSAGGSFRNAGTDGLASFAPGPSQTGWKDPFLNGSGLMQRPVENDRMSASISEYGWNNKEGEWLGTFGSNWLDPSTIDTVNEYVRSMRSSGKSFSESGWSDYTI